MTPVEIAELAAGIIAGGITLSAVVSVAIRGYWQKSITPLIQEEIKKFTTSKEYVADTEDATKKIIDNEVARVDGKIHKFITEKVDSSEKRLTEKLDVILETQRENARLSVETANKIGRLQGAIDQLPGVKSSSTSQTMPAVPHPKRGV